MHKNQTTERKISQYQEFLDSDRIIELKNRMNNNSKSVNGCIEWTGARAQGYGAINIRLEDGKQGQLKVTRLLYCHAKGIQYKEIAHLELCHHCDNPGCVNVDHLFAGTAADNMHDRYKKNRYNTQPFGFEHSNSKITKAQLKKIIKLWKSGVKYKTIATIVGLREGLLQRFFAKKTWGKLTKNLLTTQQVMHKEWFSIAREHDAGASYKFLEKHRNISGAKIRRALFHYSIKSMATATAQMACRPTARKQDATKDLIYQEWKMNTMSVKELAGKYLVTVKYINELVNYKTKEELNENN